MSDTEYTVLVILLIGAGTSLALYISSLHSKIKHIEEYSIPHVKKVMQSTDRYIEEKLDKTDGELKALENYLCVEYIEHPFWGRIKPKENRNEID